VPGYLGLRLIQNLHEITDADFLVSHEIQESQPRIVAESLKEALNIEALVLDLHQIIIYVLTHVSIGNIVVLAHMSQGRNDDRPIA
jgi:hypothetical protein